MKITFKMKKKAFFISFKGFLLKQIKQTSLESESPTLRTFHAGKLLLQNITCLGFTETQVSNISVVVMLWGTLDSLILVLHSEVCLVIRPL